MAWLALAWRGAGYSHWSRALRCGHACLFAVGLFGCHVCCKTLRWPGARRSGCAISGFSPEFDWHTSDLLRRELPSGGLAYLEDRPGSAAVFSMAGAGKETAILAHWRFLHGSDPHGVACAWKYGTPDERNLRSLSCLRQLPGALVHVSQRKTGFLLGNPEFLGKRNGDA